MHWTIKHGDILDEPADVLVCSANVFLNLSGGVSGSLLLRYGNEMQERLHQYLADRGLHFISQGEVISCEPHDAPYKAILHAVAVDTFHHSSPSIIVQVVSKALQMAASMGARRVVLAALGTGYGRLTMQEFAQGVIPLLGKSFPPVEEIVICPRNADDAVQLSAALSLPLPC